MINRNNARHWYLVFILTVFIFTNRCFADDIFGQVVSINGQPIISAQVILDKGADGSNGNVQTIFTNSEGAFRFKNQSGKYKLDESTVTLSVRKLGYEPVAPSQKPATIDYLRATGNPQTGLLFVMRLVTDLGNVAPASAYLKDLGTPEEKYYFIGQCATCHQFPTAKAITYARLVNQSAKLYASDSTTEYNIKYQGWFKMAEYMGSKADVLNPFASEFDMFYFDWQKILSGPFTHPKKLHEVADYLAKNSSALIADVDDYSYGAPLLPNGKTIIREYRMPIEGGVVREAYVVPGSPYVWAVNVHDDQLIRLDRQSGELKIIPQPYEKSLGLHTLTADESGNLWIGTVENSTLARFIPATEKWEFWPLDRNMPGEVRVPHDIAFDYDFHVKYDNNGKIWMTIITNNSVMSFDPRTGEVAEYALPNREGEDPIARRAYGAVMSNDGNCVWFSQLYGDVGCFNTETLSLETVIPMEKWENPRRLAITENNILYIPLFAAGQIIKYDGNNKKELVRYDLPDRSSAPYAVTWDRKRQVLWVATTNTDVIYQFDPARESFSVLPLPRKNAFLRMIALDPETNDLISAYSSYDHMYIEAPPKFVLTINPGDRDE